MDLLRSTIESVFYNAPIEVIAECILDSKRVDNLLNRIEDIIKWNASSFTHSETVLLSNILDNSWMISGEFNFTTENTDFLHRLPLLLNFFAEKVLIFNGGNDPVVDFKNLLRWRELSLLLSEEVFVVPFVAYNDAKRKATERDRFHWPNILEHNNFRLNSILDEELSDTHSHINAALDVFEFNWLNLMNHPNQSNERKRRMFMVDDMRMEYDKVMRNSYISNTLFEWVVIASAIRLLIMSLTRDTETSISRDDISAAILDKAKLSELLTAVENGISLYKETALPANTDSQYELVLDYAIQRADFSDEKGLDSCPYAVHHGERKFIYDWFFGYYLNKRGFREIADLVVLYTCIKIKIRREFIQTNILSGFTNFQEYQDTKSYYRPDFSHLESRVAQIMQKQYMEIAFRYAIQSSIGKLKNHHIEARVTPRDIDIFQKFNYTRALFGQGNYFNDNKKQQVGFVVHFIKSTDKSKADDINVRHHKLRRQLWNDATHITDLVEIQKLNKELIPIVGIDAASSELNCRPEVFAPMFRYIRFKGLSNFTFHAGEDFYDIIDGLRTIDETIDFMGYRTGCRIGHGLALGLNAIKFYTERHRVVIIPRQILLDNLVWMKFVAASNNVSLSPETSLLIDNTFRRLTSLLKFSDINSDIYDYWRSMRLRGDAFVESPMSTNYLPDDVRYSLVSPAKDALNEVIRLNEHDERHVIFRLNDHYEKSVICREEGNVAEMIIFPKSFAADVTNIQELVLTKLEDKGIVIETNPSSNVKIGRFNRYDEHPITTFHGIDNSNCNHSMVSA